MANDRARIAIIDQNVTVNAPAGSCVRSQIIGLSERHDVDVFSGWCDIGEHRNVNWIRVPTPGAPNLLRYLVFQALCPVFVFWRNIRTGTPDITQCTQGQFVGARISYAHFCHRDYLKRGWKNQRATGLRRLARWLNSAFNAYFEARAFRAAEIIVVPSAGLKREIEHNFPGLAGAIHVIANPIDLDRFSPPRALDTMQARTALGLPVGRRIVCFVALGDFERKGLGELIAAMATLPKGDRPYIAVVGGSGSEIGEFREKCNKGGVADDFGFAGLQKDVRPYLWASNALALVSTYETFSLVALQAAAAGLPILSTRVSGVEDWAMDGDNCWLVSRDTRAIGDALSAIATCDGAILRQMGERARLAVSRYGDDSFRAKWLKIYDGALKGTGPA